MWVQKMEKEEQQIPIGNVKVNICEARYTTSARGEREPTASEETVGVGDADEDVRYGRWNTKVGDGRGSVMWIGMALLYLLLAVLRASDIFAEENEMMHSIYGARARNLARFQRGAAAGNGEEGKRGGPGGSQARMVEEGPEPKRRGPQGKERGAVALIGELFGIFEGGDAEKSNVDGYFRNQYAMEGVDERENDMLPIA